MKMKCPNCGKNNVPGTRFCQNCGYSFADSPKKNPLKYILIILLGVIILTGVVFGGYKIFVHKDKPVEQVVSSHKVSSSKKKDSSVASSKKQSEKTSSSRTPATNKDVVPSASSSNENETAGDSSSTLPDPIFADGQTTVWESTTEPYAILIVEGLDTVRTAHIVPDSATTPTHYDDTFNIDENESGNEISIHSLSGAFDGGIKANGDRIIWNDHGIIKEYTLKSISGTSNTAND